MNLLQKILLRLNGLHYRQEYLCLDRHSYQETLHAYLVEDGRVVRDVTDGHAFIGYAPVLIALPRATAAPKTRLVLSPHLLRHGEAIRVKDEMASLELTLIHNCGEGDTAIDFYEAIRGRHQFLSRRHQAVISLYNNWFHRREGNVFLQGNLYSQVQAAYALPRSICLVTVAREGTYNLFPTDLHGPVGPDHYVLCLRHAGKACAQVQEICTVRLTQMEPGSYRTVYALGKNHMQPLKGRESFPFQTGEEECPLPQQAVSTCLLTCLSAFDAGIHRVMIFRYSRPWQRVGPGGTLAHVHQSYATWRRKNGLPGNYLLR